MFVMKQIAFWEVTLKMSLKAVILVMLTALEKSVLIYKTGPSANVISKHNCCP